MNVVKSWNVGNYIKVAWKLFYFIVTRRVKHKRWFQWIIDVACKAPVRVGFILSAGKSGACDVA